MNKYVIGFSSLGFALLAACATKPSTSPEQQQFVTQMQAHGFSADEVETQLARAEKRDDIIALMTKPAESKPWKTYGPIFLVDSRLKNGVAFWQENKEILARAEQQYGVPAQYIVSIIGIETNYGRFVGKHRVLDALYTLSFHYPARAPYFTGELTQFFILAKEQQWDMTQPIGSYAGAMGYGQFMPTSYRKWAVDFDGDGQVNLFTSTADAIGSVANYFKVHGWESGGAVMSPVDMPEVFAPSLLYPKRDVNAVEDLLAVGMKSDIPLSPHWRGVLVNYEENDGMAYYIGYPNFRVITRYNRSIMYARVVHEFAQQLQEAMSAQK